MSNSEQMFVRHTHTSVRVPRPRAAGGGGWGAAAGSCEGAADGSCAVRDSQTFVWELRTRPLRAARCALTPVSNFLGAAPAAAR